jgi:hypothetical protein
MRKFVVATLYIIIGISIGVLVDRLVCKQQTKEKRIDSSKIAVKTDGTYELFKVYGSDKAAMNIETNFYISIPKSLPIIEKLRIIADRLSRFKFSDLPIEVLRIENQNGKKIAIINLKEHEWNRNIDWSKPFQVSGNAGATWRTQYFQGTTGGGFTTVTLIETFLQNEYSGDWIDGIRFMYENQPIDENWNHILLSGVIYRDPIKEILWQ